MTIYIRYAEKKKIYRNKAVVALGRNEKCISNTRFCTSLEDNRNVPKLAPW